MKSLFLVALLIGNLSHAEDLWKDFLGCYQTVEVYKNKFIPEADRVTTVWSVSTSKNRACGTVTEPCEELWMEMADKKNTIKAFPYQVLNNAKVKEIKNGIEITFLGALYNNGHLEYANFYKKTELRRINTEYVHMRSVTNHSAFAEATLQKVECPPND